MKAHPIFENISLWGRNLPNRAAVAPMSRISATSEGLATEEMIDYYTAFARGGFGLIITEGIYTDNLHSQGYDNQPALVNEAQTRSWKRVTASVKGNNALIVAQLMHAGALSQNHDLTISPSALKPIGAKMPHFGGSGEFGIPTEMKTADIENARNGFILAAVNALESGFDGVELHAANGYLLDQFLTAELNHRTDGYGGTVDKSFQIMREIIDGIRQRVPDGFIIGLRLSEGKVNELTYRWKAGHITSREVLSAVKELPIDYIHIAVQTSEWERDSFYSDGSSFASIAREVTGMPVIANGGMHDLDKAERALTEGHADLVSIGKAALADPFWPAKTKQGIPVVPFHRDMLWPEATISQTRKIARMIDLDGNYLPADSQRIH